jgi:hypothetical protein
VSGSGVEALLVSPFNVKWECYAQAGGVEESKFCLFSVVFPVRCISSISPRFHFRRHTFCFLPLAAILESPPAALLYCPPGPHAPANRLQSSHCLKAWLPCACSSCCGSWKPTPQHKLTPGPLLPCGHQMIHAHQPLLLH